MLQLHLLALKLFGALRTELWKKLSKNLPQPDEALQTDKPWWQPFVVPDGKLVLNHLTSGLMLAGMDAPVSCSGQTNGYDGPRGHLSGFFMRFLRLKLC